MATDMEVKLAKTGMNLEDGKIFIAPSEIHLEIHRNRAIVLNKFEKVNFVCPSIDVAMKSIRPKPGFNIAAAILTGIGTDGAKGLSHIKRIGGTTMAQNEATCIIYVMPKAAVATGNVDFVLPPEKIGDKIKELVSSWHAAKSVKILREK